tara:strand:+ start:58 stop:567 length:510 start_codon:yes stop_codon:yes gene_type:complete
MSVFKKLDSGEYERQWKGHSPFYLGCGYGHNSVELGGEEKFSHCYDYFSGIGDIDYWVMEEVNKLSQDDQDELLSILKRNTKVNESITLKKVEKLCEQVGYQIDETQYIYRLKNKHILTLLDSKNPKETHQQILDEIDFDPVTLRRKDYVEPKVMTDEEMIAEFERRTN